MEGLAAMIALFQIVFFVFWIWLTVRIVEHLNRGRRIEEDIKKIRASEEQRVLLTNIARRMS